MANNIGKFNKKEKAWIMVGILKTCMKLKKKIDVT